MNIYRLLWTRIIKERENKNQDRNIIQDYHAKNNQRSKIYYYYYTFGQNKFYQEVER